MKTPERLLTELERQREYLEKLPKDFDFPLFNTRRAIESQRRSGYRDTAAAAREIVDNSIEAGARQIYVVFARPVRRREHERRESVAAVAFIDKGSGMLPKMARYALSWGGSSHFDDPSFIAKFGFGLPNASINQTRRVEVYTRTDKRQPFMRVVLDIDEVPEYGTQCVKPAVEAPLPDFVQRYLTDEKIVLEHGTVVVWDKPDRLTYRMAASLKEHLLEDFGVTYRYLLDRVAIRVEGVEVTPVDPLFLDPRGRDYLDPQKGGAQRILDRRISVKYTHDSETGGFHLSKVESEEELKEPDVVAAGVIGVKIARLPVGFAVDKRGKGGPSASPEAHRRMEVRKPRRGMSFVRAGREIQTLDAFPRSPRDVSSGLGDWPQVQSYALHWGVEVSFGPELDDVFGITNDKQTVRPIEDFWRVLAREEIDKALKRENAWQEEQRDRKKPRAQPAPTQSPAEAAAAAADTAAGVGPRVPDDSKAEARAALEEEARHRAGQSTRPLEEVRQALAEEHEARRYRVDYLDDPRGPFYEPRWVGTQVVVMINRSHPFYSVLYGDLLQTPGGERAKEAVDVLLLVLGRAELELTEATAKALFRRQRERVWSERLSDALDVLSERLRPSEEAVHADSQEL